MALRGGGGGGLCHKAISQNWTLALQKNGSNFTNSSAIVLQIIFAIKKFCIEKMLKFSLDKL